MAELDSSTRTPIIRVGTTEAVKSVKDLRDNIRDLRDEIVALSNSEKKDADTAKALADAERNLISSQQELNRVMGVTKKGADGVEGSYNNLKAQLRETKAAMDAIPKSINGQLNPAWDALAQKYKELNNQAKQYDFELGNFQRNVGNYGNAWQSIGQSMGQVRQVGGDMVNGLSAAASTLAIMGVNTDAVNSSMKNFQLVLAAVQGLKGIAGMIKGLGSLIKVERTETTAKKAETIATQGHSAAMVTDTIATEAATTATNKFKTALISTGIGALVVALGVLIAHLEDIVKWVGKAAAQLFHLETAEDDAADASDNLLDSIKKKNTEFDREIRILEAQGTSRMKILEMQRDNIRETLKEIRLQKTQAELRIAQLKADHKWWKFWDGVNGKIKKENEKIDEWTEAIKELEDSLADKKVDIIVEGITSKNEAAKKAAEEARKAEEEYKKAVADSEKQVTKLLEVNLSEYQKIKKEHTNTLNEINAVYVKERDALQKRLDSLVKSGKNLKEQAELTKKIKEFNDKIAQNTEIVANYYNKTRYSLEALNEFNKEIANRTGQIMYDEEDTYKTYVKKESLLKKILGYSDYEASNAVSGYTAEEKTLSILSSKLGVYENIHQVLKKIEGLEPSDLGLSRDDFFKQYSKNSLNMLDDMVQELSGYDLAGAFQLSKTNNQRFTELFTEPLATAIVEWGQLTEEFENLETTRAANAVSNVLDAFGKDIDEGNFRNAQKKVGELMRIAFDTFPDVLEEILPEIKKKTEEMKVEIFKAVLESDSPLEPIMVAKGTWAEAFKTLFDAPVDAAKETLRKLREELSGLDEFTQAYLDKQIQIDDAERRLHAARMKRMEAWNKQAGKYLSTYGAATSNMLSSVADAWEESLRSQENVNESAFDGVKALQYSTAVINTAAAVVQAMADPTVPSYYVKLANAAAAVAAGVAQCIKIANTKYGTDSGANSAPKLTDRTPQLQYTYGINTADYATAMAQNPVRAYIVDKDLAEGMSNYEDVLNETSF